MRASRFALTPLLALALSACADSNDTEAPDTLTPPDTQGVDTSHDTDGAGADTDLPSDTDTPPVESLDVSIRPELGSVILGRVEKEADLITGPKAEGTFGDFVLRNHHASFLVEGLRKTGGYRQQGGVVADIGLGENAEDSFGELWFAWNFRAFIPESAEIISNGSDGVAVLRIQGRTHSYDWIKAVLGDLLLAPAIDISVTYEYRLKPDSTQLELHVILHNDTSELAEVSMPLVASNMGDNAPTYTPNVGLAEGREVMPWLGAVGTRRSYGLLSSPENPLNPLIQVSSVQLSLLPTFNLSPGAKKEFTFHYVVTDNGTTDIEKARAELYNTSTTTLSGTVTGQVVWDNEDHPSNTHGMSWVVAKQGEKIKGITPVAADGAFELVVEGEGPFTVQAFAPRRGSSEAIEVSDASQALTLALPELATVVIRVRDENGQPVPAQVDVTRVNAPSPYAPQAVRFEPDWGRSRSAVLFHLGEQTTTRLLPGEYRFTVTHGMNWEIAETTRTLVVGEPVELDLVITKAVDDSGYISADLHTHAYWSPDSHVPYTVRMRQAAANDIQVPVFTEHTFMGAIAPWRSAAAVDEWITPVPGQEISTVEYGHFNAYPLVFDQHKPSGGAVYEHNHPGTELFDAIKAQHSGDKIFQVNHPRLDSSIQAYFNAIGFNSETVTANLPERLTLDFDVLEVFNATCLHDQANLQVLQDWFNMNDNGVFKAVGAGSDSHSEGAGLGFPRVWMPLERSQVEANHAAMIGPLRARQNFISCGPFVRFTGANGEPPGSHVQADADGKARFNVRVESPSWIGVSEVRLLENGVPVHVVKIDEWERPDGIRPGIRFDGVLEATPSADAWYVVEVMGTGDLSPLEPGETPYALTNVITVDAERDGTWQPPVETNTTRPNALRQVKAPQHVHVHDHDHSHAHAMRGAELKRHIERRLREMGR